jgi:hypothetical protein
MITFILVHLAGREKSWNLRVLAIPEGQALRNHDPFALVVLGLIALQQIVLNFNEDTKNK